MSWLADVAKFYAPVSPVASVVSREVERVEAVGGEPVKLDVGKTLAGIPGTVVNLALAPVHIVAQHVGGDAADASAGAAQMFAEDPVASLKAIGGAALLVTGVAATAGAGLLASTAQQVAGAIADAEAEEAARETAELQKEAAAAELARPTRWRRFARWWSFVFGKGEAPSA